ncbi:MAG: hypothetical protein LBB43_07660 [Spirochaetaceae bacterium]|jgi:nitroreductase|nr:hypothetical protein [Spirochaetaceae bacterium]
MNIFSENKDFWGNAIDSRRSVRSYERTALSLETIKKIQDFVPTVKLPFSNEVKIVFFKTRENHSLANNLKKPPEDAVAFITDTSNFYNVTAVGFVGQLVLLYAQGLGVSNCWFGHYFLDEIEQLVPDIDNIKGANRPRFGYGKGKVDGVHAVCVSPLGYFKSDGIRAKDRITSSFISFKWKPLDDLLLNGIKEISLPDALRTAFNMARKAPSAANTQHWRYLIYSDNKTVEIRLTFDTCLKL